MSSAPVRIASSCRLDPAGRKTPASRWSVIRQLGETTPILGVCLGHQAIGAVFGGDVVARRRADARQDVDDRARRPRRFRRHRRPVRGLALPLADRRRRPGCPRRSRSPRGRARTATSWACGTGRGRCTACSSTPSRSSPARGDLRNFLPRTCLTRCGSMRDVSRADREADAPRGPHRATRPPPRWPRSWRGAPRRRTLPAC